MFCGRSQEHHTKTPELASELFRVRVEMVPLQPQTLIKVGLRGTTFLAAVPDEEQKKCN